MPKGNSNIKSNRAGAIKRNPSSTHPWARNPESQGFVWIHINAFEILDQQSKGVGRITVNEGAPLVQFAFLAPLNLTETNAHNWNEYDSMTSRLAQKVRTAAKIGAEWNGLVRSFEGNTEQQTESAKGYIDNIKKNAGTPGTSIAGLVRKAYNKLSPHSIPKIKVDTPLYYENSDRRTFTFEVMLVAERDPQSDIIDTVKDLMKFAAPALEGTGGINIKFPYMFEVYTRPNEFIKFSTLALTAVQPTYNSPYISGYPSSCNLQLTFKDLSPLYRSAIEEGTVINVIGGRGGGTGSGTEEKDYANNNPLYDPFAPTDAQRKAHDSLLAIANRGGVNREGNDANLQHFTDDA